MIFLLLAIGFSVYTALNPIRLKNITFDKVIGSLFAINFLFALKVINIDIVNKALVGDGFLEPWKIILIFLTVTYVSISTDTTGFFDYLSYKIVEKAKGSELKLFIFFYLFAGALTIFTSNDIVILTLTPIILYISKYAKINIIPFLFAEFFAANTFSMLLYIGNPTNIIVASSLDLGFIQYLKVMIVPTITAGVLNFAFLYYYFRSSLKSHFKIKIKSHFVIKNRRDALLSISMMISMFICLLLSEVTHTDIWIITLFYALLFVVKDLGFSIYYYFLNYKISKAQIHKHHAITENEHTNDFLITVQRIPWGVTIFVASFFIFVESLISFGAIDLVTNLLLSASQSLYSGIMSFGFFSIILTNLVSNQPMTIFMSNVLISENLKLVPYIFKGSIYSLVIASNLGANISLIGALAGLMWKNILHIKGVKISFLDFFKVGIVITPIVFTITLISLFLVLR